MQLRLGMRRTVSKEVFNSPNKVDLTMIIIRKQEPTTWQELKQFVSEFWEQCGMSITVDESIETAEGDVSVDVIANEDTDDAGFVYLCQCRHWPGPAPEDEINKFRTIVQGSNAKTGFILSGTESQNEPSNLNETDDTILFTWQSFQDQFSRQWVRYQTDRVQQDTEDLSNYCDPLEKFVSERMRTESDEFREQYRNLSDGHMPISMLAHRWNLPNTLLQGGELFEVFDCQDAWHFMVKLDSTLKEALQDFDDLFKAKP